MDKFLTFTTIGLTTASIYAIAASGLVVTFTTSGIFNFAHGAFSMFAAFAFWQLHMGWGLPMLASALIVVFIWAPIFGALVERVIMRGLSKATDVVKVVVTVSLMAALMGLAQILWDQTQTRTIPAFFDGSSVKVFGVFLSYHQLLTMAMAIVLAVGLWALFRYTRLGVAMRAVVDDRSLMQLNGGRPARISMLSWGLGAGMAAISGVLYASTQALSATTLTLYFLSVYGVAVFGRLRSYPLVFLGAVILGLVNAYTVSYLPSDAQIGAFRLGNLPAALPAIMLFVAIIFLPQGRIKPLGQNHVSKVGPAPTMRFAIVSGVIFVVGTAAIGTMLVPYDLGLVNAGYFYALIALSLVPLTGYAGQISLAQMTFTGIAAIAMVSWGANGEPWIVVLVVILCAVVGAVMALPALRLSGIYLALATAAFAMISSELVFSQITIMPGGNAQVPQLDFGFFAISTSYQQLILTAILFAAVGCGIIALRRSSWGRRLTAMKDSPVACSTLGLNLTTTKVGIFALSAAIAGGAGAVSGRTILSDQLLLPASLPLTMMAVVGGIGTVSGAFFGGLLFGSFSAAARIFANNAVGFFSLFTLSVKDLLAISPGMMGISLGRDPDGASPQAAAGFRSVTSSPGAVVITAGGFAAIWLVARLDHISNWSWFAASLVFLFSVVPVLPYLIGDSEPARNARTIPVIIWMVTITTITAFVPWGTMVSSNGLRVLYIFVVVIIGLRGSARIHGAMPNLRGPEVASEPPTSPDDIGLENPITRDQAEECARMLGVDEDLLRPQLSNSSRPSNEAVGASS